MPESVRVSPLIDTSTERSVSNIDSEVHPPEIVRFDDPGPEIDKDPEVTIIPALRVMVPVSPPKSIVSPLLAAVTASRSVQLPDTPSVQCDGTATPSPSESTVRVLALAGEASAASNAVDAPPATMAAAPSAAPRRRLDALMSPDPDVCARFETAATTGPLSFRRTKESSLSERSEGSKPDRHFGWSKVVNQLLLIGQFGTALATNSRTSRRHNRGHQHVASAPAQVLTNLMSLQRLRTR